MPENESEELTPEVEIAADALSRQHERMVELRRMLAESARRNVELYGRILEEQALMKKELERLKRELKRLASARS